MATTGKCCICGVVGRLTFEHVPPRAAFNDKRVFEADIASLIADKWSPGAKVDGRYKQAGAGKYSLCEKCNSDTGSWYGTPYVDFAQQAMRLVHASKGEMSLAYPYRIRPLRVLKQIIVMFFSACGPDLQKAHPDLVRFVLNKESQAMPRDIQIFGYLHHPTKSEAIRQSGLSGVLSLDGKSHLFSEIAFPPFGFMMSVDHPPVDARLFGLDHFSEFSFHDRAIAYLKLPVLPVVSWLPGDFRTGAELEAHKEKPKKLGSLFLDAPFK